ncbi:DUF2927 domain-containing protein [Primorskyibacter sp. 2E107]|uniref:DUF2927 domain-containing protein n=1 Tax=Primorskyibacter sp. 2E107 TaxID=3403458 RepID=UPI003AF7D78A
MRGGIWAALAAGVALVGLAACDSTALAPRQTDVKPQERPAGVGTKPQTAGVQPSAASVSLQQYYARIQADLLVRGLLRTDGGGPDTQFTDTMLARNFERIALAEEYERGAGLTPSRGDLGGIKKWVKPIRMAVEFGARVPKDQIAEDRRWLTEYAQKLSRITGHPISMNPAGANFHVLFMSEDDKAQIKPRIKALVPDVNPASLDLFDNLPRSIHCLVIAFSDEPNGFAYGEAIAVIRTEHPDLLRRSCIHEEVAQGLGLGNDSPRARPSIFNDDDEFALLTRHDEMLLKILYDPELTPGMSAERAAPIVRRKAAALIGGSS